MKKEVVILGAGISGLTAAINLRLEGYDVIIYEIHKDVGTRFKGDLQGLENWSNKKEIVDELKDMNIKLNFDHNPFSKVYMSETSITSSTTWKRPFFYLVKRGSFNGTLDYGLKKQALKLGVKIEFNKTINKNKADIIAIGPDPKKTFAIDKGIIFKTKRKNKAVLVLNDKLGYQGYSYLLIDNHYGCLCSVSFGNIKKINKCFEEAKKFFEKKYNLNIQNPKKVGGIGNFAISRKKIKTNKNPKQLYVGEAGGFQDLLLGFGMRFAFESGYLAARSIIEKKDYQKLIKKKIEKRLKAGIVDRYIFEKFKKLVYFGLVAHPKLTKWLLYPVYNYTIFHRMIYSFARKRLMKKYPNLEL